MEKHKKRRLKVVKKYLNFCFNLKIKNFHLYKFHSKKNFKNGPEYKNKKFCLYKYFL